MNFVATSAAALFHKTIFSRAFLRISSNLSDHNGLENYEVHLRVKEEADFYPMRGDLKSNSGLNEPRRILVWNYGHKLLRYRNLNQTIIMFSSFLRLLTRFRLSYDRTRGEKSAAGSSQSRWFNGKLTNFTTREANQFWLCKETGKTTYTKESLEILGSTRNWVNWNDKIFGYLHICAGNISV